MRKEIQWEKRYRIFQKTRAGGNHRGGESILIRYAEGKTWLKKRRKQGLQYCRVNTLADFQDGSYEVQCEYYRKPIEADPAMELVGIYGDHGKSGKEHEESARFQRMIKGLRGGKDRSDPTKSISRFARNLKECIAMIRHLRELE